MKGGVYLPFKPRFHDRIRQGIKTHTLRSRKYGNPGDVVNSPVGPLRIVAVIRATPRLVRDTMWKVEGCDSPDDFQSVWEEIHGRGSWAETMEQPYYLHRFEVAT